MSSTEIVEAPKLSLTDQIAYANAVNRSDIIPTAYRGKPANVIVAVGFGQSIGLSPAESLYRINVIQGKPTMSAELIAAQVRKAGHKLRLSKDEQHMSATCTIIRSDDPDAPFTVTRDQAWAQKMGLASKDNYRKQPLTMLTWRAITACAREACPEALFGVAYTPDEMHDMDPQPADVQAQQPAYADPTPIKHIFEAFAMAEHPDIEDKKARYAAAQADILGEVKGQSMHELTEAQVRRAVSYMEEEIAAANRADVPADEPAEDPVYEYEEEF